MKDRRASNSPHARPIWSPESPGPTPAQQGSRGCGGVGGWARAGRLPQKGSWAEAGLERSRGAPWGSSEARKQSTGFPRTSAREGAGKGVAPPRPPLLRLQLRGGGFPEEGEGEGPRQTCGCGLSVCRANGDVGIGVSGQPGGPIAHGLWTDPPGGCPPGPTGWWVRERAAGEKGGSGPPWAGLPNPADSRHQSCPQKRLRKSLQSTGSP